MLQELHGGTVRLTGGNTESAVENSRVVRGGKKLRDRLARAGRTTATYARNSYLYEWLTREPEPEVIVIDLRKTRAVGPVISLLDRVVDWVTPYWRTSTVKRGVDRLAASIDRGLQTRPGKLLVALLEPPEPPEQDDGPD